MHNQYKQHLLFFRATSDSFRYAQDRHIWEEHDQNESVERLIASPQESSKKFEDELSQWCLERKRLWEAKQNDATRARLGDISDANKFEERQVLGPGVRQAREALGDETRLVIPSQARQTR